MTNRLPDGFTVRLNRDVRAQDDGAALIGGWPSRALYLTELARSMIADGTVHVNDPRTAQFARMLMDAGMADPVLNELPDPPHAEVTVVVPVRDRPEALDRLLASIRTGVPTLVVDDGSAHPELIAAVVERRSAELVPLPVNVGPAAARNEGLRRVSTRFVAFVDSDMVLDSDTIPMLLRHFADPLVALVAPRIVGLAEGRANWIGRYENARSSLDMGEHSSLVRPLSPLAWLPAACMVARVDALGDGFGPGMRVAEDVDLVWRLADGGWRIRYEPAVQAHHEHRASLPAWFSRKAYYGTGAHLLAQRHPLNIAPAVLPPWSVALLMALLAQRRWSVPAAALFTGLAAHSDRAQAQAQQAPGAGGCPTRGERRRERHLSGERPHAAPLVADHCAGGRRLTAHPSSRARGRRGGCCDGVLPHRRSARPRALCHTAPTRRPRIRCGCLVRSNQGALARRAAAANRDPSPAQLPVRNSPHLAAFAATLSTVSDNKQSFIEFVGRVLFPRNPGDLRGTTHCPACLEPLGGRSVCAACRLDLNHPAAAELTAASMRAADALDDRLEIIGRMRFETDQALAAASVPAAPAAAPASSTVAPPPAVAPPVSPPPAVAPRAKEDGAPRRSTVQVLLVVVGISLLSIFLIFGLVYAFINWGVLAQSLIIGAVTVAAFVIASWLYRKKLTATAEGIGALAVVLVYLDAWAIRVNDFFGLATSNEYIYWGATLLITSVGFLGWHRVSSLSVASVAAHLALVPGTGLLTAGLLNEAGMIDGGMLTFLSSITAATAGLLHRVTVRSGASTSRTAVLERILMVSISALALLTAFGAAWTIAPENDLASALALIGIAVVAFAHSWALLPADASTAARSIAAAFTGFGALAAALAAPALAVRSDDPTIMLIAPGIAAVAIALVFENGWRRLRGTPAAASMLAGAIVAGSIAALATLASTIVAMPTLGSVLASVFDGDRVPPLGVLVVPSASATEGLIGASLAIAALAGGWALLGVLRARGHLVAWAAAVLVLLAVPELRLALPVALGYAVIAAVALVTQWRTKALPAAYRPVLITVLAASTLLSFLVGWAGSDSWWVTVITTVLILIASRHLVANTFGRAALAGAAVIIALIGVSAAGERLFDEGFALSSQVLVVIVAALLLVIAALPVPGISPLDRRVTFWVAVITGVPHLIPGYWSVGGLALAQQQTIASAVLLVALVTWVTLPFTRAFAAERIAGGLLLGPIAVWLTIHLTGAASLTLQAAAVTPMIAAVAVPAAALAAHLLRAQSKHRWAADAGAGAAGLLPLLAAVEDNSPELWIVLLLAGVGLLLASASRDGVVGSVSGRKHLGWASLALATGALWLRLFDTGASEPEPFVLPLAGVLLIIGLLTWRFGVHTSLGRPSRGAPFLLMAGLLVAIVPLAIAGGDGPLWRPLVVGGISGLLLLVGTLVREKADVQPYLDAVAIAGVAGVVLVAGARTVNLLATAPGTVDGRLEAWAAPAAALLIAAAIGLARGGAVTTRSRLGQWLVVAAIIGFAAVETVATDSSVIGTVRVVGLVLLLSGAHVLMVWVDRMPFPKSVAWIAIGVAGVAGAITTVQGFVDPFEYVTVPIALALLASGGLTLSAVPTARSWAWLAPGLLLLLVPSLLTLYFEEPLWRVVGVGVVATIAIVVGAVRRLQAPFLIGTVVLLVHLITQLWPGIRLVYESLHWWLWLGFAGVILIALAARYEQRIKNFRSVAMRIAALR